MTLHSLPSRLRARYRFDLTRLVLGRAAEMDVCRALWVRFCGAGE